MCNPMAYAAIAASTAQQIGQYQMGKAAHEQSKSFAERNAVNARKAFYQTLKDLTARGQQESEIIAKNTQQLTAKIGQRRCPVVTLVLWRGLLTLNRKAVLTKGGARFL